VRDTAPRPRPRLETKPATGTEVGTVKWFDDQKGFGKITQGDGTEMFVHHTGILGTGRRSLREGQRVTYTVGTGPKGRPQAQNVQVVE